MVGIDHGSLDILAHTAGAEEMHAKLLLLRREAPLFYGPGCFVNSVRALKEPNGKFQIIGMVFVGQEKSG